jgi:hypothetical protein
VAKPEPSEWVWYQEYKNCSCTEIRVKRSELLGYCRRHMTDPRRTVKLPRGNWRDEDLGFCEN